MGGLIVKIGQSTLGLFPLFGLMLNGPNTHFTTLNIHPTTISINIKNCHINIYIKLQFFKEKIIVRITLLFFSWQPNTIQTLKKNINTTVLRWVYFSIEMVGFDFYSNPKSSLSLLEIQKTKLKGKNPKASPK